MSRVQRRPRAAALDAELHRRGDQVRHPRRRSGLTIYRFALALLISLATPVLAADALEPGAEGYLLTALEGQDVERIPLHFIGTYDDFLGPGFDLHLVELKGPVAEHVGVAAGMSGSPVYIGGRLIGALSYRMGVLPKDAIAGVTPIEAMRAASRSAARPAPSSDQARPIRTPLSASGLHPEMRDWAREQLETIGMILSDGATATTTAAAPFSAETVFEPGSPIGVALVRGGWSFAATGTVTVVEDGNVLAFGHPFLGTGAVEFPMHTATVIHTLADAAGSRKMGAVGDEVGAIVDDRITAVVGRVDRKARMIPLNVSVLPAGDSERRTTDLEVVDTPGLTPLLVGMSVSNSILNHVDRDVAVTVMARGTIRMHDRPDVPFELSAAGNGASNPMVNVAANVQQTLATLWNNPFERPAVESIEVEVDLRPELNRYFVESLHYDREAVSPGGTVRVHAALRPWRGETIRRTLELQVPHGIRSGTQLRLAVGPPSQVQRALGNPLVRRLTTAEDIAGVLRVLGEIRSEHRLVAVLYHDSPTVVRDGAVFAGLPPTAEHLLSRGTRSGAATRATVSRLAASQLEMDGPVSGGLTIRVLVEDGAPEETQEQEE